MVIWAADVGGTNIRVGLVEQNRIAAIELIPAHASAGLGSAIQRIIPAWRRLQERSHGRPKPPEGIALAIPAVIGPNSGRIYKTPGSKYDDAHGLDLAGIFSGLSGRVYWCNDAHAALAGEHLYGAATSVGNVVLVTLGTGIGSAVMLGGRTLAGSHGLAGNLSGHSTLNPSGPRCPCGNVGCAELYASTWRLNHLAKCIPGFEKSSLAGEKAINYEMVFRHARRGDRVARELADAAKGVWSAVVSNLVHQYDPDLVLIGGGISARHRELLPAFRRYVRQHCWARWRVPVRKAALGANAGLIGVAALAVKKGIIH
jgi:glucokinase